MHKYQKDNCLKTFDVLFEAHSEIIKYMESDEIQPAESLLDQCLQGVVSIASIVEKDEETAAEQRSEVLGHIEEYGGFVIETRDCHGQKEVVDRFKKHIDKVLLKTKNSFANSIRQTRLVVFLPYKASMWDSFETEWRRLDEDPDCDVKVMPIPYYDLNPDGSYRQMHYEGADFPKDVPITSCELYDLSKVHPDTIYIHNPYDDMNLVTTIHPNFYSKQLKQYTDELIYIPYFVLWEPDLSNPDTRDKIIEDHKHFVVNPGVINADKVIVQSENMKTVYVENLTKWGGEQTREIWENKIFGTGSPKLERVANLKAEDYILPPEWEAKILRPDGTKRKIILYNTGLSALLNENEKMIAKIRDNLLIFKENSEDVILLWRPHPLIEATLKSMRPGLLEEYKEITDSFKNEDWGIFDDTPNLDRAIAISDAYYGDWSSLVTLYKETGKPIMIQNCEVLNDNA